MKKTLSENSLGGIIGGVVLLIVLGVFGYFYFILSKPAEVAVKESVYDTSVIANSMNKEGVFDNTVYLNDVPQSQGATVRYTEEELGKQNLTQSE